MKIFDFIKGLLAGKKSFILDEAELAGIAARLKKEVAARELALGAAVNLIAATVSICEVKVYRDGEETKGADYYRWNVRPNPNESAARFMHKLVSRLLMDNEALVIFENEHALVADTFAVKDDRALYPCTYSGVSANGMDFARSFDGEDVCHFKLHDEDARRFVDTFYEGYKSLISASLSSYSRTRAERGVLQTTRMPGDSKYEETIKEMMQSYFKPYFENDNAVLPLFEGQSYSKTSTTGAREITAADETRKLMDDVFDMAARAFRIPPALLRGEMADTSQLMTNFLTFCIDPLCKLISDEITAKNFTPEQYISGGRITLDASRLKHYDILDAATAVDKLVSSGVLSVNEIREAIGKPKADEEWGDGHFITKNYTRIENLDALEGD